MKKYTALIILVLMTLSTFSAFAAELDNERFTDGEFDAEALDFSLEFDDEYYGRFRGENRSLSVYNWALYIADGSDGLMDINKEFENLTGIKVNYTNFATNEEMYAKIKSGGVSYDVVVPSDYMIGRMIKEDMLEPLDHSNIPNIRYIEDRFWNNTYDPGNVYSVPYAWGLVGIIYNTTMVDEEVNSWDILWDEKYSNQILMFDNSRDAFAIALKKLGYSLNTEDPDELRAAAEALKEQKPLVQAYVQDQIFDKMEGNEAALAPYYAGDGVIIQEGNDDIEVAFPDEGTNLFMDAMCIMKGSENKELGEMYINFLNEAVVAADNMEEICYSTPNWAAHAVLDEEMRNNPIIYPDDDVLDNTEQFINLSEEANLLVDQLWTEVRSASNNSYIWVLPVAAVLVLFGIKVFLSNKKRKDREKMSKD